MEVWGSNPPGSLLQGGGVTARRWCDQSVAFPAVVRPSALCDQCALVLRFLLPLPLGVGGFRLKLPPPPCAVLCYIYIYMWSFHQFHAPYQRCCYSTKVSAQNCLGSHQVFFWFSRCSLWIPAWWLRATRWAGYLGSTCGVIWVSGCYLPKP